MHPLQCGPLFWQNAKPKKLFSARQQVDIGSNVAPVLLTPTDIVDAPLVVCVKRLSKHAPAMSLAT
jgi:hypothetical protein